MPIPGAVAAQGETLFVRASASSGEPTSAALFARQLSRRERIRRALKVAAWLWLAALAFVLVPFLHLFFVPGLFLAGLWAGARIYAQRALIESGSVKCPSCGANFGLGRIPPVFPRREHCSSCRNDVLLAIAPDLAPTIAADAAPKVAANPAPAP